MSILANWRPKAKARPVHGVAKWLSPTGFLGIGVLAINGTPYTVTRLSHDGRTVGYRLEKPDGTAYDVSTEAESWRCDCPDGTYRPERPGGCKHVAGLRAALASAGQQ